MNIIYFTTAQESNDYNKFLSLWNKPINSSNQIFHNKLIRSLSLTNHIDVISLRPYSKDIVDPKALIKDETISSQIHWHYLKVSGHKFNRYISYVSQAKRIVKKCPKDSLIITDTINPGVLEVSNIISKLFKLQIIGVCTDSPSNITGTTRKYTKSILRIANNLSGYITLTAGLNELFNEHNKPCIVIEGLVDSIKVEPIENKYGKYIFMAGALNERYGLYNLIDTMSLLKGINLVFAGHHADENKINELIKDKTNIFYLGSLPNKEIIALEQNAIANINPRPYNEDLDRYSIPSKVLEYLNSGVPTISVKNTKLYKMFSSDIIWVNSNKPCDLLAAIEKLDALKKKDSEALAKKAKEDVNHYFSLEVINKKLSGFLYLFTKRDNNLL